MILNFARPAPSKSPTVSATSIARSNLSQRRPTAIRRKLLMGKERPKRLGEKLGFIRKQLELSQNEMVRRLGLSGKLTREEVSAYERGVREPSLPTLSR